MYKTEDLAVWWLSEKDMIFDAIDFNYTKLPDYIYTEYSSREGRPGGARLWVPHGIEIEALPVKQDHPLFLRLNPKYGGIVFYRKDIDILKMLPGIITDLYLNIESEKAND